MDEYEGKNDYWNFQLSLHRPLVLVIEINKESG
jgi:hypothetical protein